MVRRPFLFELSDRSANIGRPWKKGSDVKFSSARRVDRVGGFVIWYLSIWHGGWAYEHRVMCNTDESRSTAAAHLRRAHSFAQLVRRAYITAML